MVPAPAPRESLPITSSRPRAWETRAGFSDQLYEWMSTTPWLALSAAAHLTLLVILSAIPWDLITSRQPRQLHAKLEQIVPDEFQEPLEEPPPELQPPEEPTEPQLQDVDLVEQVPLDETLWAEDALAELADPSDALLGDRGLDTREWNDVIGIGGGASGHFGDRFGGGRAGLRVQGGGGTEKAVVEGLEWLARHQAPDGSWDCDGFVHSNSLGRTSACDGPGEATHDVGMTGLALLAFLADGSTTRRGPYRAVVTKGVHWLREHQDPDSGLLGLAVGRGYVYDHAIGTLALCEAYYFSHNPLLRRSAQDAVDYILKARNPHSGWRYSVPPDGASDTSVTGWMVLALASAEEGGLDVDPAAYAGALSWIDEMTDPVTGRVGYQTPGSLSSRIPRVNDTWPPEKGEAMTAVGLLCRFFLGQTPQDDPVLLEHAALLARTPPAWDPDGRGCDMYYWYYGSYAMYQMGGSRFWEPWNRAMKKAVVDSQRHDGDFAGSWDPTGPWGFAGGRVYSTALMTLCLEVYFRYSRVLGAR